jgi:hypothetical protein
MVFTSIQNRLREGNDIINSSIDSPVSQWQIANSVGIFALPPLFTTASNALPIVEQCQLMNNGELWTIVRKDRRPKAGQ